MSTRTRHNIVYNIAVYCCMCVGVQGVLDKLAREVEKNTQLSSELQEGENGKQQVREIDLRHVATSCTHRP